MSSTSADPSPSRPLPTDPPPAAPAPPPPAAPLRTRLIAEAGGTFWLVLCGCGTAVIAASYKEGLGVGLLGVALAFGLAVLTAAYAVGHISGGHFNPAVTVGLAIARRFEWRSVVPYVITQVVAATAAGAVLFVIAHGKPGFDAGAGFATNGYGPRSPGGYSLVAGLVTEVVLTAVFVYIILSVTDNRAPKGFGPLAIGLTLAAIHLISIPVTNTSVNPARSIGVAWFAGAGALSQLWLFILAPLLGATISGLIYSVASGNEPDIAAQARTAWSTVRRTG